MTLLLRSDRSQSLVASIWAHPHPNPVSQQYCHSGSSFQLWRKPNSRDTSKHPSTPINTHQHPRQFALHVMAASDAIWVIAKIPNQNQHTSRHYWPQMQQKPHKCTFWPWHPWLRIIRIMLNILCFIHIYQLLTITHHCGSPYEKSSF